LMQDGWRCAENPDLILLPREMKVRSALPNNAPPVESRTMPAANGAERKLSLAFPTVMFSHVALTQHDAKCRESGIK